MSTNEWDASDFDPLAVEALNEILSATDAEIIITSDWRYDYTLSEMRDIFKHFKVSKVPIGFTPLSQTYTIENLEGGRADEIKMWLLHNAWKQDINWVVVDDLNMSKYLGDNFVFCSDQEKGLAKTGVKNKILEILQCQ